MVLLMSPCGTNVKSPLAPIQEELSEKDIYEKVRSINAMGINVLGERITSTIVSNFFARNRMEEQFAKKDTGFISEQKIETFSCLVLWSIKDLITKAFSTPIAFVEDGIDFLFSDPKLNKKLKEAGDKIEMKITDEGILKDHCIRLKIDLIATAEKKELVFSLTQQNQDVEFSEETFTIKELEEAD